MNKFLILILVVLFAVYSFYAVLPNPPFPAPPPDSVQSDEFADLETPFRRAYFTDYTRDQVIEHYKFHFRIARLWDRTPIVRLNYPPEESQTLIRDQTRSTFLEELVHPFRESIYINGFEPKQAKDDIWFKGRHFQQKIIIRYVPSTVWVRLLIGILVFSSIYCILIFVLSIVKNRNG